MAVRPALSSAMVTAISAKTGYSDIWLIEILGSSNTLRYTTMPNDVSYDSKTWTGIGGLIEIEAPPETTDPAGQSCRLNFSGVEQSIIAEVLTNNVRGRTCNVYWGQVANSDGVVQVDPLLIFSGMMNTRWEVQETPSEVGTRGTVRVGTTVVSDMSRYQYSRGIYTNQWSLRNMQKRAYNKLPLEANPITTTSGSTTITVACTAQPQRVGVGDQVTLSGATATGGISAARLNVQMTVVSVPDHHSFTATLGGANATSSATGGGSSVVAVYGHDISAIVGLPDLFFNTLPDLVNQPIFWGRQGASVNRTANAGHQNPGDLAAL